MRPHYCMRSRRAATRRVACAVLTRCIAPCALLAVISTRANAQTDTLGSPAETKRTCSAAAAKVQDVAAQPAELQQALLRVRTCPDDGPESIRAAWARPPRDSTTLWALARVSGQLRDRRVFEAVRGAATNREGGTATRLAAIASLVSLFDDRVIASFTPRVAPNGAQTMHVQLSQLTHPGSSTGGAPLEGDTRDQILGLLTRLGDADTDRDVRSVSAQLAKRLRAAS